MRPLAAASAVSRYVVLIIAFYAIFRVHHLPRRSSFALLRNDLPSILKVAGAAIMGGVTPVAFAAVFALSGAIGPIIGQNAGAGLYQRVCKTLLGTIPCVYLGSQWYGAPGVMAGEAAGAVLFGLLTFAAVLWQVRQLDSRPSNS